MTKTLQFKLSQTCRLLHLQKIPNFKVQLTPDLLKKKSRLLKTKKRRQLKFKRQGKCN